jgi:hypothetical protein
MSQTLMVQEFWFYGLIWRIDKNILNKKAKQWPPASCDQPF